MNAKLVMLLGPMFAMVLVTISHGVLVGHLDAHLPRIIEMPLLLIVINSTCIMTPGTTPHLVDPER